jgi:hypothetical protein
VIALNVVALLFVLFHAVTWFNLADGAGGQCGRPARAERAHRGWQLRSVGGASALIAWALLGRWDEGRGTRTSDVHTNEQPLAWLLFGAGGVMAAMTLLRCC